jgi:hypothetical protein
MLLRKLSLRAPPSRLAALRQFYASVFPEMNRIDFEAGEEDAAPLWHADFLAEGGDRDACLPASAAPVWWDVLTPPGKERAGMCGRVGTRVCTPAFETGTVVCVVAHILDGVVEVSLLVCSARVNEACQPIPPPLPLLSIPHCLGSVAVDVPVRTH